MKEIQHYYFVGIGGAGMSGIARVLRQLGYTVSGSDLNASESTRRLASLGVTIYEGHRESNLEEGVEALVVSSAIPQDNPELVKARRIGLPIYHRADMLGQLMSRQKGIAIAGAHGKTTTTSMISLILERNGWDPTVIVGGELTDIGGNAKLGQGEYLVAEADESDGSFLKLYPYVSVVTNIEDDHMEHYGSKENINKAFRKFISQTHQDGGVVLCLDNTTIQKILPEINSPRVITYGIESDADYTIRSLNLSQAGIKCEVLYQGELLGELALPVPGKHNLQNALAAITVCHQAGIAYPQIADSLQYFHGVQRRFQKIGDVNGVQIFDDYAHHPTELKAALAAAKTLDPKRVLAAFQPHRYTRTNHLFKEFGSAFQDADLLFISEIYAAGEKPIPGVNAELIVKEVKEQTSQPVEYIKDRADIVQRLAEICQPGDLIITMGAGNIWTVGQDLNRKLQD